MSLVYVFDYRQTSGAVVPFRMPTLLARAICRVGRFFDYAPTTEGFQAMTNTYRFGVEVEVSGGASEVLAHLYDAGHVRDDYFHDYHCGKGYSSCDACDPHRSHHDWTGQEDCTADGEFVSRILTTGQVGDDALANMADALVSARAVHSDRVGMHVHTDAGPFVDDIPAIVRLWRLWLTYEDDVATLARQSYGSVRSYNAPAGVPGVLGWQVRGREDEAAQAFFDADHDDAYAMLDEYVRYGDRSGRWLSGGTGAGTWEFRIWNASRSLWRMRTAAYVSVGMTLAALNGHEARPDDGLSLLDAIADYLPDDVVMGIVKQLAA